jgi:hypothetical protein
LIVRLLGGVTIPKEIFTLQADLAVLDRDPLVAALPLGFVLIVPEAVFVATLHGLNRTLVTG